VVTIPENGDGVFGDFATLEKFRNRRVFIETYGCRYNFGDTAKLVEILKYKGSKIVESAEGADSVIINTCTVVGSTERRMLRRLSLYRNTDLYVTGCMPAVQREAIFSVCTPTILSSELIHEAYRNIGPVGSGGVAIVQIARGCVGTCTYCLTKVARGPLKSVPEDQICNEIYAHALAGTPEIQITAQDISCWGKDIGKSLPSLLHKFDDIPGRFMIRLGMMNPGSVKGILDDLVEAFSYRRIFKFLHLPVQSGSDSVLKRMGREYTVSDFEEIVGRFKNRYPEITLATDMIVGFPGETDEDFLQSLDLIDRIQPNKVNITRYSARPFTPISSEKDFPDWIKKDRSRIMNARAEQVYAFVNQGYLNKRTDFVVTEKIKKGSVMARSPHYVGIVLNESLPIGCEGQAILKKDKKYFFIGQRII
jgi:threonylcarbamoyladenosine tRNA methylthiotransferase CDKAL1